MAISSNATIYYRDVAPDLSLVASHGGSTGALHDGNYEETWLGNPAGETVFNGAFTFSMRTIRGVFVNILDGQFEGSIKVETFADAGLTQPVGQNSRLIRKERINNAELEKLGAFGVFVPMVNTPAVRALRVTVSPVAGAPQLSLNALFIPGESWTPLKNISPGIQLQPVDKTLQRRRASGSLSGAKKTKHKRVVTSWDFANEDDAFDFDLLFDYLGKSEPFVFSAKPQSTSKFWLRYEGFYKFLQFDGFQRDDRICEDIFKMANIMESVL